MTQLKHVEIGGRGCADVGEGVGTISNFQTKGRTTRRQRKIGPRASSPHCLHPPTQTDQQTHFVAHAASPGAVMRVVVTVRGAVPKARVAAWQLQTTTPGTTSSCSGGPWDRWLATPQLLHNLHHRFLHQGSMGPVTGWVELHANVGRRGVAGARGGGRTARLLRPRGLWRGGNLAGSPH
jgi:hypothetical protein